MKFRKDIYKYSKREIDILYKVIIDKLKNNTYNDKIAHLEKSDYIEIKNNLSKNDVKFILENIKDVKSFSIYNNKFEDILLNIDNILNIEMLHLYNFNFEKKQLSEFIKKNNIKEFNIYKSNIEGEELFLYNTNTIYIDSTNNIKDLKYVESENINDITIHHNICQKNRYIEWNNKNNNYIKFFAIENILLKNINPIENCKHLYLENLNQDIIDINIKNIEQIIINNIHTNLLDLTNININSIEIDISDIDKLLLNSSIKEKYITLNNTFGQINILIEDFEKSFINYYEYMLKNNNQNFNDIELYNYLKFLKKYKNIYNKYKNISQLDKNV